MRLIDADEYAKEMKRRQDAVSASIEHPIADRYYTDKEHWEGVMLAFVEAKLTLDKMPTVDAVPLDKLCEWLSDHAGRPMDCVGKLCGKCEFDGVGVGQEKCWENLIKKWMEEQHDHN